MSLIRQVGILHERTQPFQSRNMEKPVTEFKSADLTEIAIRWGYSVKPNLFEQFGKEK